MFEAGIWAYSIILAPVCASSYGVGQGLPKDFPRTPAPRRNDKSWDVRRNNRTRHHNSSIERFSQKESKCKRKWAREKKKRKRLPGHRERSCVTFHENDRNHKVPTHNTRRRHGWTPGHHRHRIGVFWIATAAPWALWRPKRKADRPENGEISASPPTRSSAGGHKHTLHCWTRGIKQYWGEMRSDEIWWEVSWRLRLRFVVCVLWFVVVIERGNGREEEDILRCGRNGELRIGNPFFLYNRLKFIIFWQLKYGWNENNNNKIIIVIIIIIFKLLLPSTVTIIVIILPQSILIIITHIPQHCVEDSCTIPPYRIAIFRPVLFLVFRCFARNSISIDSFRVWRCRSRAITIHHPPPIQNRDLSSLLQSFLSSYKTLQNYLLDPFFFVFSSVTFSHEIGHTIVLGLVH